MSREGDCTRVVCSGDWTMGTVNAIDADLRELERTASGRLVVDATAIGKLDTAGAWLIDRLRRHADDHGLDFRLIEGGAADGGKHGLIEVLRDHEQPDQGSAPPRATAPGLVDQLGRGVVQMGADLVMAFHLIGASIQGTQSRAGRRGLLRPTSIVAQIDQMGRKAVPVIAVMSMLIGGILAQQGAYQLRYYGEELLTVDLVGILLLREVGVLLTAIMVAGRTGSAITAEIGTMKQREEIDALNVMGLNPVGVLILPRLIALLISLPILVLIADIAGLLGAMIVCDLYVGITPKQFLDAFQLGVGGQPFIVGLVKAPVMALVIGLVAAIEGLKVGGSAESLGERTTASVVRAIFVVIFMDGLFAIFFASTGF